MPKNIITPPPSTEPRRIMPCNYLRNYHNSPNRGIPSLFILSRDVESQRCSYGTRGEADDWVATKRKLNVLGRPAWSGSEMVPIPATPRLAHSLSLWCDLRHTCHRAHKNDFFLKWHCFRDPGEERHFPEPWRNGTNVDFILEAHVVAKKIK